MSKATADAQTALTVLRARPEVDPHRAGVLGHSFGGNTVIFHAALDHRVAFAATSGTAGTYRTKIASEIGIDRAEVIPGHTRRARHRRSSPRCIGCVGCECVVAWVMSTLESVDGVGLQVGLSGGVGDGGCVECEAAVVAGEDAQWSGADESGDSWTGLTQAAGLRPTTSVPAPYWIARYRQPVTAPWAARYRLGGAIRETTM